MKFKEIWEKVKKYDYKKLLCVRNYVIAGCVALLAVAVVLNATLPRGDGETVDNESTKILGNSPTEGDTDEAENFFASAVINRQRVRDEAMAVLREVADSPDAMQDAKEDALESIERMVNEMNCEVNIETLVKAKGFEECVAVISEEKCSVIVKSEGLKDDQVAQILDIVITESDLSAENITIIEKTA